MTRCVLLLLAILSCASAATEASGSAEAPVLPEHEPYAPRLVVRNPNDRAVKVARVEASCTCARQELASSFLLPRATTTLDLVIDNASRSGAQRLGVTIYLTDPELDPIELVAQWQVRPDVAVDALPPGADSLVRPDPTYRDVYRYLAKVRPDELHKLGKRIRLSSPPEGAPADGLRVLGVEYAGDLWRFAPTEQADGSILITASARDPEMMPADGLREEVVTVLTNHPRKPRIDLRFITYVGKDAGAVVIDPDAAGDKAKQGPRQ